MLLRVWQRAWLPLVSRGGTLMIVLLAIGTLPWLSGQDPAWALLRARTADQEATAETLAAIRASLGLDQGPWVLFWHWLTGLFHGDAGVSWVSGRPIMPGMLHALGVSLTLMACALGVALVMAAMLCLPTLWRGMRGQPRLSNGGMAAVMTALPEFLLAALLLMVFAVWWPVCPPFGWKNLHYAVLPALAMGLPAGGMLGRLGSDALASAFSERWLVTWQVAGVRKGPQLRAVIRRALPVFMPQLGLVMIGLTGGAIAVEKVFAIPGLGRATLGAVAAQDMPTVQTGMLLLLSVAIGISLMTSLIRQWCLGRALHHHALPAASAVPTSRTVARVLCWSLTLMLVSMVLFGILRDPYTAGFARLQPPSLALPFGADATGRDLLARLAHGTYTTCTLSLVVVMGCLAIGVLTSLAPRLCAGPIDVTNALPTTLAGLAIAAVYGPSEGGAVAAVMIASWAPLAAHAHSLRHELKAQPYMAMLPVLGVGRVRQITHHLLPAMMAPLLRHAMLRLPGTALALAALGFLGLGPQPPAPEWGLLLADNLPYLERAPWGVLFPALALIMLAVIAVTAASAYGGRTRSNQATQAMACEQCAAAASS